MTTFLRFFPWVAAVALLLGCFYLNEVGHKQQARAETAELRQANAEARLERVVQVNQAQRGTIDRLVETQRANDRLLVNLSASVDRLSRQSRLTQEEVQQMERNNAQVRQYLDQPLPPDLAGVLNRGATAAGGGGSD